MNIANTVPEAEAILADALATQAALGLGASETCDTNRTIADARECIAFLSRTDAEIAALVASPLTTVAAHIVWLDKATTVFVSDADLKLEVTTREAVAA